jgi:hypothetical protein
MPPENLCAYMAEFAYDEITLNIPELLTCTEKKFGKELEYVFEYENFENTNIVRYLKWLAPRLHKNELIEPITLVKLIHALYELYAPLKIYRKECILIGLNWECSMNPFVYRIAYWLSESSDEILTKYGVL